MIKTLARRVTTGTLAAVAAIGMSTLFATAASAHTAGVTGVAHCDDAKGVWTITWTISNDFSTKGTVESPVLTPADSAAKIPDSVDANSSVTFTSTAAGKTTSASFSLVMVWPDHFKVPGSKTIELTGPCVMPSPSPSPSKPTESTPTPSPSPSMPGLPVTGSNTTYPMVGAGAGLIAAGGVLLFVIRRRRRVTFTAE